MHAPHIQAMLSSLTCCVSKSTPFDNPTCRVPSQYPELQFPIRTTENTYTRPSLSIYSHSTPPPPCACFFGVSPCVDAQARSKRLGPHLPPYHSLTTTTK